jgi:GAF domain-containing protein
MIIFIIGLFIFISLLFYKWRISIVREKEKTLKKIVNERTSELSKEKVKAEKAHHEIESLNLFSKKINESTNLDEIIDHIFDYIIDKFQTDGIILSLVDNKKNEIYFYKATNPEHFTEQMRVFIKSHRVPLNEKGGMVYKTYLRKRPFYQARTNVNIIAESDRKIIEVLGISSFLIVPMTVQNEVIAMALFTSYKRKIILNKIDINRISGFCEQIAGAIYSASLIKDVQIESKKSEKSRIEIEKLNEFTKKINETTNIDTIMDQIFEYFEREFNIEGIIVLLIDKEKNEFYSFKTTAPTYAEPEMTEFSRKLRLPLSQESGMIYKTYLRKRPFYLSKVDERALLTYKRMIDIIIKLDLKSFLLVPLVIQDEVIAITMFTSYKRRLILTKPDIKSISHFCEQIAGAIYSSSLLKEIEEEREKSERARMEIEKLNQFAQKINETTSYDQILDQIFKYVQSNFKIEGILLQLVDKTRNELVYNKINTDTALITDDKIDFAKQFTIPLNPNGGFAWKIIKRKKPVYFRDFEKLRILDKNDPLAKLMEAGGLTSGLIFPLVVQDEIIGVVYFSNYSIPMKLTKSDITSISRFCEQIAGAVYSASLLNEVQAEREISEKARLEIQKLNEISKKINEMSDIDEMLEIIFDYFNSNFNIESVVLQLVDNVKNELYTYTTSAPNPPNSTVEMMNYSRQLKIPLDDDAGIIFRTYLRKKPFYLSKIDQRIKNASSKRLIDIIENLNLQSFLLVPLIIKNKVIAMLMCTSYFEEFQLNKQDIASISRFCEQIAGAIYTSSLLKEIQEEREKAETAAMDALKSRDAIKKLNETAREINSALSLDKVLELVFNYFQMEFDIDAVILQLVDKEKNELYTYNTTVPSNAASGMVEYSRSLHVPLKPESGILYHTYLRKRPFYLAKVDSRSFPEGAERAIIDNLKLKSFLITPLVIQNEVIAQALFTSYDRHLKLNRNEIARISGFCDQIAGAIHSLALLKETQTEREKSDKLLLNILPSKVADELKTKGRVDPLLYDSVSIMFTDFKGFTRVAHTKLPDELVEELDTLFEQFDRVCEKNNIEKLKTIGDSYMAAGGIPDLNFTHPIDICLCALEIQYFMNLAMDLKKNIVNEDFWEVRLGIHTGPVMAGVIGKNKFAYDVWGDTVNIASRMESGGTAGRINISEDTYKLVKDFFHCKYRGNLSIKNRGKMKMYFLNRIKPKLAADENELAPNKKFKEMYESVKEPGNIHLL